MGQKGGKRPGAGRPRKPRELSYFEAVKAGAPPERVTAAVASVLKRAEEKGDGKCLDSVLKFLLPVLTSGNYALGLDAETRKLFQRYYDSIGKHDNNATPLAKNK